jgi:phage replication-related protein YjqB (UPF0714/DUF867 family)
MSHADWVVTIHGEASSGEVVYLGGLDEELTGNIETELRAAGFVTDRHTNPDLQGRHQNNICNRGIRGRGVQLELSRGLRERFFESLSSEGRTQPREELDSFAAAVRTALGTTAE